MNKYVNVIKKTGMLVVIAFFTMVSILTDPKYANQDVEFTDPEPIAEIATQQLRKLLENAIDTLPARRNPAFSICFSNTLRKSAFQR